MKENGLMIWLMGSGNISIIQELSMKVIGKMIINMVRERKNGQIKHFLKENI